jgi:hypothetical protein
MSIRRGQLVPITDDFEAYFERVSQILLQRRDQLIELIRPLQRPFYIVGKSMHHHICEVVLVDSINSSEDTASVSAVDESSFHPRMSFHWTIDAKVLVLERGFVPLRSWLTEHGCSSMPSTEHDWLANNVQIPLNVLQTEDGVVWKRYDSIWQQFHSRKVSLLKLIDFFQWNEEIVMIDMQTQKVIHTHQIESMKYVAP